MEAFQVYIYDFSKDPSWIQFVVIDKKSNRKIGQINYLNVAPFHQRGEIGGLWYMPKFHANTESTLLMLTYLFGKLKYRRGEWKYNAENIPSGKVAAKLGFTEGIFRQHMFTNGANRDTKGFSLLDFEWLEKKQALMNRLCYTKEDEENIKVQLKRGENDFLFFNKLFVSTITNFCSYLFFMPQNYFK